jgi:hypothetical protein
MAGAESDEDYSAQPLFDGILPQSTDLIVIPRVASCRHVMICASRGLTNRARTASWFAALQCGDGNRRREFGR